MKPLVEATVFDETGSMRATFFNQPWLAQRYEPGTRLVLHGKTTERGTFNVAHHALGADLDADLTNAHPSADAPARSRHYPATEGVSSTQILALVQGARGALAGRARDAGSGDAGERGAAGSGQRARGDALPARRGGSRAGPRAAGVRGAAADAAGVPAKTRAAAGEHDDGARGWTSGRG